MRPSLPLIEDMETGHRYFVRSLKIFLEDLDLAWENTHQANRKLLELDDQGLWYIQLDKGESINFSDPEMASIKNKIDILNENLHTLGIIAARGYQRHASNAGNLASYT